ncbi:NAD-dependent epimerase/dehydratase family protein [Salinibacterium sp. SYSU T00001]|uniref:NAD-dependent epimerase/dehydratase family protein n=1 Tax=Homoserinimonas sedimenticola TaxID=2986805 RepID=UPI002236529E|nr:NAD-dependent epimerase/dehydratase family protein [Salinibacterium sedimenticola]MCW4386704.1 NAD-dependent epimerase/dehydratase family protein [Salinibacterium sedimenticola]
MRVLVTGASGALGGDVARLLLGSGHEVRTLQRRPSGVEGAEDVLGSVTDAAARERACAGVDAVVHLAAKVSMAGPLAEFEATNVAGTAELLAAARRGGATRFVHVSSPSVAHSGDPIMGEGAGPADPERAHGPYARTKARGELLALAADAPGFAVVAVRPHLVWGPGDTQLIGRIVERARRGTLPLLGSGAALIDTTYRDNAASALVAALDRAEAAHGRAFVVTNGEPRTIAELFEGICRAAGVRPPRWRVPASAAYGAGAAVEALWSFRPGADEPPMTRFLAEQLSTAHWFDQRETRAALAWEPAVSIDEGLERLAESFRRA